jgi:excisionase family DNA binding protein
VSDRLEAAIAEFAAAIREEVFAAAHSAVDAPPAALLSIDQAAARAGIGRSLLYGAIGRGQLRSVKVGRRRLVPADAIGDLINERGAARPEATPRGSNGALPPADRQHTA